MPGALHPVILSYEKNEGLYEEPNVWVVNTITAEEHAKHRLVDQSNWRKSSCVFSHVYSCIILLEFLFSVNPPAERGLCLLFVVFFWREVVALVAMYEGDIEGN